MGYEPFSAGGREQGKSISAMAELKPPPFRKIIRSIDRGYPRRKMPYAPACRLPGRSVSTVTSGLAQNRTGGRPPVIPMPRFTYSHMGPTR